MKFYRIGNRPKYIDLLKSRNEKAMITKLRVSAHKLRIEGGRYINILKCERFCNVCDSGEIEVEEHFLFKCSLYKALRQGFRSKIKNINNQSRNLQTIVFNHSHCNLKTVLRFHWKLLKTKGKHHYLEILKFLFDVSTVL